MTTKFLDTEQMNEDVIHQDFECHEKNKFIREGGVFG